VYTRTLEKYIGSSGNPFCNVCTELVVPIDEGKTI
jgi:hypothetical protein